MPVHVDNGLVATNSLPLYYWILMDMNKQIEVVDQDVVSLYLGIWITHNCSKRKLWLSQCPFIVNLLTSHNLMNAHSSLIPLWHALHDLPPVPAGSLPDTSDNKVNVHFQCLVGSLLYLTICMRPNISYATMGLERFNSNPTCSHLLAAKGGLRYLLGTIDFALKYNFEQMLVGNPTSLFFPTNCGFSDANWASNKSSYCSVSGFSFYLYSSLVSWSALSQRTVALLSTEVEYMVLAHVLKDGTWIQLFLIILGLSNPSLFPILWQPEHFEYREFWSHPLSFEAYRCPPPFHQRPHYLWCFRNIMGFYTQYGHRYFHKASIAYFTQEALYVSQSRQFTLIFSFLFNTYIPSLYHFMCSIALMEMCWTLVLSCHRLHTHHMTILYMGIFDSFHLQSFPPHWTLKMYVSFISDCPTHTYRTRRPVPYL